MEVWKDAVGYEGIYEVSNEGEFKSLSRRFSPKVTILKKWLNRSGYLYVRLSKNNKGKSIIVHRLIAQTFISNPSDKKCVNHKNGIKTDNRVENLEWVTYLENTTHGWETGLYKIRLGDLSNNAKLTEKDIKDIRKLSKFYSYRKLATIFGVGSSNIALIVKRETWKHI